jgi:hypothetical protein
LKKRRRLECTGAEEGKGLPFARNGDVLNGQLLFSPKWVTLQLITRRTLQGESQMLKIHEEYLTDVEGNKKAVVVPLDEWQRILEALEELDDIRAYEEAKSRPSDPIPFDQGVDEVRRGPMPA